MKQNKYKEESPFRRFRKNMEGLSFEQKIDHIFRYYWGTILLVILIPVALGIILSSLLKDRPDLTFTGNCCNITLTDEGVSYLTDDWSALLNMEPGALQVNLNYSQTAGIASTDVDMGVQVLASVAADDLDYILCDSVAVEFFALQSAFLPVDRVLDQETFSQWADRIYSFTNPEEGITYHAAIDVTDLPFFRDTIPEDGKVYFMFANKQNADPNTLNLFLSHLTSWQPK